MASEHQLSVIESADDASPRGVKRHADDSDKPMRVEFRSVNIVMGARIQCKGFRVNLHRLFLLNPVFMAKRFFASLSARVVTTLPSSENNANGTGGAVTVSIFSTGSMISTGASSPAEARAAMQRMAELLRDAGVPVVLNHCTVNSTVYSGRAPHAIDIVALSEYMLQTYGVHAITEAFPAARFCNVPLDSSVPDGITIVVFWNGTVNIPHHLTNTTGRRVLSTIETILLMFPYRDPTANSTAWHRAVDLLRKGRGGHATPAGDTPIPFDRPTPSFVFRGAKRKRGGRGRGRKRA